MSIFPNVPDVAGVPTLLRNPLAPIPLPSLLTADSFNDSGFSSSASQWGLFDSSGNSVIDADNLVSFEFAQDWTIADYQIEQGSFETYDKVQQPYNARLTFSRGGSEQARSDFLASVEAIVDDTNLYSVVTPEKTYVNANISHYDYKRTSSNGVGLLTITLYLMQVRADVTAQYTSTTASTATGATSPASATDVQNPGSSAYVDDGVLPTYQVQTLQPPNASTLSSGITTAVTTAINAVSAAITLPIETPANQALGPVFGLAPSLANGQPALPSQFASQITYTLNQATGGTIAFNPATLISTLIPAGQSPQSTGFQ